MLWTTTIGLYLVLSCHTTLIIVAVGFSFKAIIMSALVSRKRPAEEDTPSSIITTFSNADGVRAGPPVQLDVSSSQKQLELLVNTILNNTDGVSFVLCNDFVCMFLLKGLNRLFLMHSM